MRAFACTRCTTTNPLPWHRSGTRGSTRWSTSSSENTDRCQRQACPRWSAGSATPSLNGKANWIARFGAPSAGSPVTRVDGLDWFWPEGDALQSAEPGDTVRLLAPFDPVVWDRRRFEILWGWAYRFEAYTPQVRRTFGYYALPLLWRNRVIGWGNLTVRKARTGCPVRLRGREPSAKP